MPVLEPAQTDAATAKPLLLHAASLQRSGGWLADALASEGVRRADIQETVGVVATLAQLRETAADAVVVSHEPGVLDAVELIEGLRIAGQDEAVVVLVDEPNAETELACYEAGADDVCCVTNATARTLLATLRRAIDRRQVLRDNRQLQESERQRLAEEHRDAEQTLDDQRRLVRQLEAIAHDETASDATPDAAVPTATTLALPESFDSHYRDLLRAYVIMGAGNLAREIDQLAEQLAAAGVSAERVIQLHLVALEELLGGLGRRSARHVMSRADLLVLEVVAKLADGYRRRYHERVEPARQQMLPGFDSLTTSLPPTSPPPAARRRPAVRWVAV